MCNHKDKKISSALSKPKANDTFISFTTYTRVFF